MRPADPPQLTFNSLREVLLPVHSQPRRARRFTVAAGTALVLALAASASAHAATSYSFNSYDGGTAESGVSAGASGNPAEVPGAVRMVVIRAGAVVVDKTGEHNEYTYENQTYAYSSANSEFNAQPGDVVQLFNPSTAATPVKSVTINRPTIDSCPVGSATFTGKRDGVATQSGNSYDFARGFRPGLASGDPNRYNQATLGGTGDDYVATLQRPLASGDLVYFSSDRMLDADTYTYRSISRNAGTCAPQPPAAPPVVVVPPVFNGIFPPLGKKDVKQSSDPAVVLVTIHCSALSKAPCAGNLFARTAKKFASNSSVNVTAAAKKKKAKKKVLQLAKKSFSVAPGKTAVIKLKLTKQGQRLLKRQRTLVIRVSSVAKDAATGAPRTTSRTITLKAKKAKKKKSKK
jgi:hypothetical protein